jgi:hypothetical protein
MTRLRRVAAIVLTLAAAGLATTAQTDAHAASPAGDTRAGMPHTRLHVHVTGCDRCTVTLQHAVSGRPSVWTSTPQRVGADHVATFRVRTSRTHGMSFVLRAPWEGNTGAVPNIVTRYRGQKVDSYVSRDEARHATRAEGCWAGTTSPVMRLHFHVGRIAGKTLEGDPTQIPLAYAVHSMSSWKPMVNAYRGTIANQDAFYCTKPPTTKLTLEAPGCAGCQIQVMNGARYGENVWAADPKTVSQGAVTFRVPRLLTRGISATVVAPWEGNTGYTTVVAFRYGGHRADDPVTFSDARAQTKGSPCWGGTSSTDLTLELTTRKVTVAGNTGPTAGTIAYADVTQPWLRPMVPAAEGVIGSQEIILCRK